MVLGIQKLSGASGPVDMPLPNFAANGINKPAGKVLWAGNSIRPDQNPFSFYESGIGQWTQGLRMPWTISFWIRVPSGGGGTVFALQNPGYLFGGGNNTSLFQVGVTENTISLEDNQGYTLSRSIDLNKENTGWHHIWMVYDRDPYANRLLYVDGRNVGWSTSTSTTTGLGDRYWEFSIGGWRKSTQVGVTQVISLHSVANEFDICHLGIWGPTNQNINQLYPFYDPGSTGALSYTPPYTTPATWPFPDTQGPRPGLWCEFNYSTGWSDITGYANDGGTFDPNTQTEEQIFNAYQTFNQAGTGTITEAS
jgi:hypothetical protein